ncbi:MAG TPA: hypothetical protein DCK98_18650 [Chloroflexi bacterium]|nr:hypothetical protein [Chloroflexota bacterium]HAL28582.1 hypothetical protein [Chloroflexota bacterium]
MISSMAAAGRRFARAAWPLVKTSITPSAQAQSQAGRPVAATRYNVPLVEAAVDLQTEQQQRKSQLADLRAQLDAVGSQGAALDARAAALHEKAMSTRPRQVRAHCDPPSVRIAERR